MGQHVSVKSAFIILILLAWCAAQYGLAFWALRDLRANRAVRSGNPVGWVLIILCIPLAGPLFYAWSGSLATTPGVAARQPRARASTPVRRTARSDGEQSSPRARLTPAERENRTPDRGPISRAEAGTDPENWPWMPDDGEIYPPSATRPGSR